jgi:DNA-binding CsgD family transcriptional regulator
MATEAGSRIGLCSPGGEETTDKLPLASVRSVFHLVDRVCHRGSVGSLGRQDAIATLSTLIGADAGIAWASPEPLGGPRRNTGAAFVGWSPSEQRQWMNGGCTSRDERLRPGAAAPFALQITEVAQTIRDETWCALAPPRDVLLRFSVNANLLSFYRLGSGAHLEALAFFRHIGRSPFGDAEVMLLQLFREELEWRYGPGRGSKMAPLSVRLEQTLTLLMEGMSEKEVAASLGMSPYTVHDYVKALHLRFGVHSRGELLAVASGRRIPPKKPAANDVYRPNGSLSASVRRGWRQRKG